MSATTNSRKNFKSQRGAYLVIVALLLSGLTGLGALAIDVGRLLVLRSEMQNAADAAAIAAASELQGIPGARTNAELAARNLLQHNSKFANVSNLLGVNISLEFYCAISSRFDPDDKEIDAFCTNDYDADGRSVATSDAETHYVRVSLEPSDNTQAYSLNLLLLPVLGAVVEDVASRASLATSAMGGRSFYMCAYPPVMLCNPFEPTGGDFKTEMSPGEQIVLKQQGSEAWGPGNFAFLQPDNVSGGGAPETAEFLADENLTGCRAPIVTTSTGQMTNQTANGLNTRFDLYNNPGFGNATAPDRWPPAPNVIDFPRDQTWRVTDARFGNADWDRDTYFVDYHDWQLHGRPSNWADMSRWEVYNWEISEGKLPSKSPLIPLNNDTSYDGIPDPDHLYTGEYPPPPSVPDRRAFHVAVVNCQAHGLTGNTTFPIVTPQEGFAKLFLTEHVRVPPDADIFVEYIKWTDNDTDEDFHTDIQLYE